jgi:hypothetical protein
VVMGRSSSQTHLILSYRRASALIDLLLQTYIVTMPATTRTIKIIKAVYTLSPLSDSGYPKPSSFRMLDKTIRLGEFSENQAVLPVGWNPLLGSLRGHLQVTHSDVGQVRDWKGWGVQFAIAIPLTLSMAHNRLSVKTIWISPPPRP